MSLAPLCEEVAETACTAEPMTHRRRASWRSVAGMGLMLALLVLGTGAAGYLKVQIGSIHESEHARTASVQAATDGAVAMLSYRPYDASATLAAAQTRLNGPFRDSYSALIHDVVIPAARERNISTTAKVPAAAAVTATENHAMVVVFIDQTISIGSAPPTTTASVVQVTLDKVDGRWLISAFEPK
jgi:Mce-associated membrane protein